jgi:Kef-type K+ transport system membrane component KefB
MRSLIFYISTLVLFLGGIAGALFIGYETLPKTAISITTQASLASVDSIFGSLLDILIKQFHHPLALLLSQIIIIMIATRAFGFIVTKIALPVVVGEIIAGIFLGPSFFGAFLPEYSALLFPIDSLMNLSMISQIGLIFFMFVIGMELDWHNLRNQTHSSVVISHISIIFPFLLGVLLALFLYNDFAPANASFIPFALFIGISMSITAFPVLARIIKEKGLTNTKYGAMALTCAAADDVTAWYILAVIIAVASSASLAASAFSIALIALYLCIMIFIVRPFLAFIGRYYAKDETLSMASVSIILIILLLSSLATEVIGIHALFGAFMAGAMMPSNNESKLRERLAPKLEYVSILVLLPLFFALTGLRTQIGLMEDSFQWIVCGSIIIFAIMGKLFGAAFSAKFMGFSWRESLSLGALMNTRGLMELIVLNIGFELKIIGPELFAMFVIMALVTTAMTGPLLRLIEKY